MATNPAIVDATESFVADYMGSNELRQQQLRLSRLQYGSTNIAPHGNHLKTGVLDQKTLCVFRPGETVCTKKMNSFGPARRALMQRAVEGQSTSFRSVERRETRRVEHNNQLQQARCANLIKNA